MKIDLKGDAEALSLDSAKVDLTVFISLNIVKPFIEIV